MARLVFSANLFLAFLTAQPPVIEGAASTVFGVTVVDAYGLRGEIYLLDPGTAFLPNFRKLKPVGTVYTHQLNIAPRPFTAGFPGITDRFEWFAIDYNGHFWIKDAGKYRFLVASDDGSKLFIDGKVLIDNDGIHQNLEETGSVKLKAGLHKIRIQYFQGPRTVLALSLGIAGPSDTDFRVFDTREFRPPE